MHQLRVEAAHDGEQIRAVHEAAFGGPDEARIVDALRSARALSISLVATRGSLVVGHIGFSPITIDGRDVGALGLAPVAVLPAHQRMGIGDALCRRGLETARGNGARACVVLGHASYYPRFGFVLASTFGLRWEGGHDESFFAIELVAGSLAGVSGVVRYRPEVA